MTAKNNQKVEPRILKGFRDFLPDQARKRQYAIGIIRRTFELYGFEPLETPAIEYEDILLGKYGPDADKLLYRFEDLGKRKIALRYDQTVPLARVNAQYENKIPIPFERYQIQSVWRAENPQKGRFREFLQCDIDIVGTSSYLADVEVLDVVNSVLNKLGFKNFKFLFNSRIMLFNKIEKAGVPENLRIKVSREIDKIEKVGWSKVKKLLTNIPGIDENTAGKIQQVFKLWELSQPDEIGQKMNRVYEEASKRNIPLKWDLTLARGLDYYTDMIFEVQVNGYSAGAVCGGGRYDNLIGFFAGKNIPAVGCAFGFDRLIEAMEELKLFPKNILNSSSEILVTVFNEKFLNTSLTVLNLLRKAQINAEIYFETDQRLDKQLKYADKKGILYAIIIGPDEKKSNKVTIKNLFLKSQETVASDKLISYFK